MASSDSYANMAEYYATYHADRIKDLRVMPPYEPKDKDRQSQWVRGTIRHTNYDNVLRELVVTGPKMKVCYGGCNWNRIVFGLDPTSEAIYGFRRWIDMLGQHVQDTICADPGRYKSGALTSSRFTFENDLIRPANDPTRYPDEFRCKLSTERQVGIDSSLVETPNVDFFTVDSNGEKTMVEPHNITSGSSIIPVIKFTYYRAGERFGLNATVLKGIVYPVDRSSYQILNEDWVIDYPDPN